MARRSASKQDGREVKISVALPAPVHLRLRLMATMRGRSASEIVAAWVERETACVRLPSVTGLDGQPDGAGPS